MERVTVEGLGEVDVYPVGLMSNICTVRLRLGFFGLSRKTFQPLGQSIAYIRFQLRKSDTRRNLHEIRQHLFNGYLAEPLVWPEDRWLIRCGSGWTRNRAVRDLRRRYRNAEPYGDASR